jgi:hypothetical protein
MIGRGCVTMGRARRNKSTSVGRDVAAQRQEGADASDPGRSKGPPAWLAGIVSAVILAAFGVVFTEWYNAHGSDTVERVRGAAPITVSHVPHRDRGGRLRGHRHEGVRARPRHREGAVARPLRRPRPRPPRRVYALRATDGLPGPNPALDRRTW